MSFTSETYNFVLTEMEDVKESEIRPKGWPEDLSKSLDQLINLIIWKLEDEEKYNNTGLHNSYFLDLEESMEEEGWVIED